MSLSCVQLQARPHRVLCSCASLSVGFTESVRASQQSSLTLFCRAEIDMRLQAESGRAKQRLLQTHYMCYVGHRRNEDYVNCSCIKVPTKTILEKDSWVSFQALQTLMPTKASLFLAWLYVLWIQHSLWFRVSTYCWREYLLWKNKEIIISLSRHA